MNKTIVAVDDSISMRQIIKLSLTQAGFRVLDCSSGDQALEELRKHSIDMMITDLNMPKMDGIALIERVRGMDQYKYMPIIMLTTESCVEKKQAGKQAGASGWITKPFRSEQLISAVNKLLAKG